MIVVKLQGGLGNQMFQYALGRALSLKKGTELVFDITSFETDPQRTYALNIFSINEKFASKKDVARYVKYKRKSGPFRHLWNFFVSNWYKYALEKQFHFDPDIFNVKNDAYIEGYWNTEKYFKDIRSTLLNDFEHKNPLSGKNKEAAEIISKTNAVSIHVRRGDYAHNPATLLTHGLVDKDYYSKSIDYILNHTDNPSFFVFSDEILWVKENLLLPKNTTYIDWNAGNRAHEDIRLMTLCKHHIIANSTFSWWGAWLSKNSSKIVIAPNKWFNQVKPSVSTKDIIPETWIKI